MKIYLYNYSVNRIFNLCKEVLKEMNYTIENASAKGAIISARKGDNLCNLSSLIDIKLSREKSALKITIISNTLSNIFGIIYYDSKSENDFVENLFDHLHTRDFESMLRLSQHDYGYALAS